jgi:hypothetical protein
MRDTIDMALEAGFYMPEDESYYEAFPDDIKRFEALVRADAIADEREACADLCYQLVNNSRETRFAAAIRERSANAGARGNT